MTLVDLSPAAIEALADALADRLREPVAVRLAELLDADELPRPALLTAAQVAERFGLSREYVYDHAAELGAIRLGDGKRPRLRFDAEHLRRALEPAASREDTRRSGGDGSPDAAGPGRRRRKRAATSSAQLLPIRGHDQ